MADRLVYILALAVVRVVRWLPRSDEAVGARVWFGAAALRASSL
jgi:hypothetical protein